MSGIDVGHQAEMLAMYERNAERKRKHLVFSPEGDARERVLFIGTQFSILYTSMYSPAEAATPRA